MQNDEFFGSLDVLGTALEPVAADVLRDKDRAYLTPVVCRPRWVVKSS
jgi:hypothetical protein